MEAVAFINTPIEEQIEHITALRMQGKTFREIRKKTGLSLCTISRRLNDDQAKDIIKQAIEGHIKRVPAVIARHDDLLLSDDETVALNAVKLSYQITGITPSHTSNQFIQNIYIDNRKQVINQGIIEAMGDKLNDMIDMGDTPGDDDIIDICTGEND